MVLNLSFIVPWSLFLPLFESFQLNPFYFNLVSHSPLFSLQVARFSFPPFDSFAPFCFYVFVFILCFYPLFLLFFLFPTISFLPFFLPSFLLLSSFLLPSPTSSIGCSSCSASCLLSLFIQDFASGEPG